MRRRKPDASEFARAMKAPEPRRFGIERVTTKKQRWWKDGRNHPEHLFIPDTQVRAGVPIEHIKWVAQYAIDQHPDVIVCGHDWWDFPSLNSHESDWADFRTRDLMADVLAGLHAWDLFITTLRQDKGYNPVILYQEGNHCARFRRQYRYDLRMRKAIPGPKWIVNHTGGVRWSDLERVVCVDGVHYSHYFVQPNTGRPIGGTARHKLTKLKFSFTQGHVQGKDVAEEYLSNGTVIRGVVAGAFYQHYEDYKGPQGQDHWRGVIYKHEVEGGRYDLMEVSLDYLRRRYGGKPIIASPEWRADEFAVEEEDL